MSRRARIGIIIAVLGIGLAALGIFVISGILRQSLTPLPPPTPPPTITETVVVTTRDVPLGAVLNENDLSEVDMPVELIPRNAIRSTELVIGRFTKVPLVAGEMVLEHHLADPTNVTGDLAFVIGDDQVLMAFPSNDLMSTLNIIQRGDLVDILVSVSQPVRVVDEGAQGFVTDSGEEETESRLITFDALQRVEISAVVVDIIQEESRTVSSVPIAEGTPEPQPTPQPSDVDVRAYMLALNPQDALVLKNLIDAGGSFDIVLRSPTSTQFFELNPVMQEYLIDRYQLEIPR